MCAHVGGDTLGLELGGGPQSQRVTPSLEHLPERIDAACSGELAGRADDCQVDAPSAGGGGTRVVDEGVDGLLGGERGGEKGQRGSIEEVEDRDTAVCEAGREARRERRDQLGREER